MAEHASHVVCPHCLAVNRLPAERPALMAKCGSCHRQLCTGKPFDASTAELDRHIARNDIPVAVDCWAEWCGPCRVMGPAFERAASELEPHVRLLKVDVDKEAAVGQRYAIRSIPLLLLLVGGKLVAQQAGAMNTPGIVGWVRSHTPLG